MKRTTGSRRRPAIQITLERAARLHRLVLMLAQRPSSRAEILQELQIGMRTFYRELELLQRYRIKVQQKDRAYSLRTTAEQAEGRLPFPDPQLSFAEMAELAGCPSPAGRRLAELLASVMHYPEGTPRGTQGRRRGVDVPTRKSS